MKCKSLFVGSMLLIVIISIFISKGEPTKYQLSKKNTASKKSNNQISSIKDKKIKEIDDPEDIESEELELADDYYNYLDFFDTSFLNPKEELNDSLEKVPEANNITVKHSDSTVKPRSLFDDNDLKMLERSGAKVEKRKTKFKEKAKKSNHNSNNSLIGGVSSRSANVNLSELQELPEESPEPSPEPTEEEDLFPRVSGQPRGYAMPYLTHPRARQTVESQIDTLITSNINEVYISALTDGTFGKDYNYLLQVVRRLNSDNRNLTLGLYLTNGSTMRRYDTTEIDASFNKVEPSEFRDLIQNDRSTREKFTSMVEEVKPIFELNKSLNAANQNIAIVMLEDNLDSDSYKAMRDLAVSVLGENLVRFVRNPCPGCYDGNDTFSFGDGLEIHNLGEFGALGPNDGFTLDGISMSFPGEVISSDTQVLNVAQVREIQSAGLQRNINYFGLWKKERQGLTDSSFVHPDNRNYEIPTKDQIALEIELLRDGLTPLNSDSSQVANQ